MMHEVQLLPPHSITPPSCLPPYVRRSAYLSSPHLTPLIQPVSKVRITYPTPAIASLLPNALGYSLTTPPPDTSHHELRTPYYNASIPIWRDDAPTTPLSIASWEKEWSNSEAGEVVRATGAWVVCFKKPREKADLVHTSHIYGIEGHY